MFFLSQKSECLKIVMSEKIHFFGLKIVLTDLKNYCFSRLYIEKVE
jgi:hypothetical protein